jgi:hypothetical protein
VSVAFACRPIFLLLLANRVHNAQIVAIWYARQAPTTLVNAQKTLFGMVCNVKIKVMKMPIAQTINSVDKMQVSIVQSCISVQVKQDVYEIDQSF